jgi:hypothetical protein
MFPYDNKCLTDLMNPTLRRKIKDNLSAEEREALKDFKQNFPAENLRVRKEDKGPRFVIADGATEEEMIENYLKILVNFVEIPTDPKEEDKRQIEDWARDYK